MLHFRQGRELARKLLQLWKRKHQVPLGAQAVGHAAPSLMEALGAAHPVGQYLLPKSIPNLLAQLLQLSENCITHQCLLMRPLACIFLQKIKPKGPVSWQWPGTANKSENGNKPREFSSLCIKVLLNWVN